MNDVLYIGWTPPTPLGIIWVAVSEAGLVAISLGDELEIFNAELAARLPRAQITPDESRTYLFTSQIAAYLAGERTEFDLPIDWSVMSPFQQKALQATLEIPNGETRTYGEIAALAGSPGAARGVGRAEATNPIPLVIPCHRVLNADGKLHGYSGRGGLETKAWLLKLEQAEF
ncbi:MAG: methylated-DNA--[protein]-cysteine S-methyltransferase [Chloroflexi bacterium]|jgi:methylated-DNA-[protein]-cysteine S-methyltransferase|nr:methylated-DNA--[protein]-cysteine S-methyltransferase [Chloroflexota bacterium]